MNTNYSDLTPYFEDGKLHFSEKTIHLLQNAGVASDVIEAARRGLSYDEVTHASEIRCAMEQFFQRLASNVGTLVIAS